MQKRFRIQSLVIIGSLLLTGLTTFLLFRNIQIESQNNFESKGKEVKDAIEDRMALYINVLNTIQAFYSSSDSVSRVEYKTFIEKTKVFTQYPGIAAISFVQKVKNEDKQQYLDSIINDTSVTPEGYPNFKLTPVDQQKSEYYYVTFVEPFNPTSPTLGLDLTSNPARAPSILDAVSNDIISNTGKVQILGNNPGNGFVIYAPLYKNGEALDTVEQRRSASIGVLSAGFRAEALFTEASREVNLGDSFKFGIFAGDVSEDNLLYSSNKSTNFFNESNWHVQESKIQVVGQEWTLYSFADQGYEVANGSYIAPVFILVTGLIVTLMLYIILSSSSKAKEVANELAKKMTQEYQASESKYRLIFENLQDIYYKTDLAGKMEIISPSVERFLGIKPEEVLKHNSSDFYANPEDRNKFLNAMKTRGFVNDYEILLKGKDGPVNGSINAHIIFDEQKNPIGIEGIIRDITERKKIEKEAKDKAYELEKMNKLMTGRELKMIDLKKRLKKYERVDDL